MPNYTYSPNYADIVIGETRLSIWMPRAKWLEIEAGPLPGRVMVNVKGESSGDVFYHAPAQGLRIEYRGQEEAPIVPEVPMPKLMTIQVEIGYLDKYFAARGHFTGEVDHVGKHTFVTVEGKTHYLFDSEWEVLDDGTQLETRS